MLLMQGSSKTCNDILLNADLTAHMQTEAAKPVSAKEAKVDQRLVQVSKPRPAEPPADLGPATGDKNAALAASSTTTAPAKVRQSPVCPKQRYPSA